MLLQASFDQQYWSSVLYILKYDAGQYLQIVYAKKGFLQKDIKELHFPAESSCT